MPVTLGILALLEAKPDKADDLADFLRSGRELAVAEQGTVTWYAFKVSDSTIDCQEEAGAQKTRMITVEVLTPLREE